MMWKCWNRTSEEWKSQIIYFVATTVVELVAHGYIPGTPVSSTIIRQSEIFIF